MNQAGMNVGTDHTRWTLVSGKIYSSSERPCTHETSSCSEAAYEEGVFVCVRPTDIMIRLGQESEALRYEQYLKLQTLDELEAAGKTLCDLWATVKTDPLVNEKSDFETWSCKGRGGWVTIVADSAEMPCKHDSCKSQPLLKSFGSGLLHGPRCVCPTPEMLSIVDAVNELNEIRVRARELDESILKRGLNIAALVGNATRLCFGHSPLPLDLGTFDPSPLMTGAEAGAGAGTLVVEPPGASADGLE